MSSKVIARNPKMHNDSFSCDYLESWSIRRANPVYRFEDWT